MDIMTKKEIEDFEKKHTAFNEKQSINEYTATIRDIIYLWRYVDEGRKNYTLESINERIKSNKTQIEVFYNEKEPPSYAAIDIDYCCG